MSDGPGPRPLQRRARKTRDALLSAAVRVFADKGYHGSTVDEIAAAAGANKQRLYAYYGSKRNLFTEALRHVFGVVELLSRERLARAEAEPRRLTRILFDGFMDVHERHPEFWRLLSWANLENAVDAARLADVRRDENAALRRLFRRARAAGHLPAVAFESYVMALLSAAWFYHSNRLTLEHTLGPEFFAPARRRRLAGDLEFLFRGPTGSDPS